MMMKIIAILIFPHKNARVMSDDKNIEQNEKKNLTELFFLVLPKLIRKETLRAGALNFI